MSLQTFMAEFDTSTTRLNNQYAAWDEDVDVVFGARIWEGHILLSYIRTLYTERGQGKGSRALDWFVALADKHEVSITLVVCPIHGNREEYLTKTRLRKWYASRGFKKDGGDDMTRPPVLKSKSMTASNKISLRHRD